jgi:predicted CXXCH cytochrome family protein
MPGLDPSFMAVPLMVCLHCHDVKPHPVGKSHLAKPDGVKIKVDPSMPLSKTGEVTCVTCHEPHFDADEKPFRLRYKDPKAICSKCHWKG